jgi:hypothetical protein
VFKETSVPFEVLIVLAGFELGEEAVPVVFREEFGGTGR